MFPIVLRMMFVPRLVVLRPLDFRDDVAEILLLNFAEDDVSNANRGERFPEMKKAAVARLNQGPHRISGGFVEHGAALREIRLNKKVPLLPQIFLILPLFGVPFAPFHDTGRRTPASRRPRR